MGVIRPLTAGLLVSALAAASARWARQSLAAITVSGHSMSPTLTSGDRVLVRLGTRGLRRGRIVVVARPDSDEGWAGAEPVGQRDISARRWYIKRATAVAGDAYPFGVGRTDLVPPGHIALIGDNPVSVDSKQYGPCPEHQVLGIMLLRLRRGTG
ncbi:S26 family signal peptidase [Streptomyces goshikiensis]|uniref:S26 family signal peptidase n=1 Tax=Streptomyces goshikiensis TaxID=1942 RepID=UPI00368D1B52